MPGSDTDAVAREVVADVLAKVNKETLIKLDMIAESLHKMETGQAVMNEAFKNLHRSFDQHITDDAKNFARSDIVHERLENDFTALDKWKATLQGQMLIYGAIVSVGISVIVIYISRIIG